MQKNNSLSCLYQDEVDVFENSRACRSLVFDAFLFTIISHPVRIYWDAYIYWEALEQGVDTKFTSKYIMSFDYIHNLMHVFYLKSEVV